MSTGRAVLVALGLLIAAGGIFLVVRGFRGADAAGSLPTLPTLPTPPAAEPRGRHGRNEEKAPGWGSFVRPGERETPLRPLVRFASGVADPFDRLPAPPRVARPGNPGFRLEGISGGARPVALISGHAVREGGAVSGFRVVRISRSEVLLAGPRGDRLGLRLGGGR